MCRYSHRWFKQELTFWFHWSLNEKLSTGQESRFVKWEGLAECRNLVGYQNKEASKRGWLWMDALVGEQLRKTVKIAQRCSNYACQMPPTTWEIESIGKFHDLTFIAGLVESVRVKPGCNWVRNRVIKTGKKRNSGCLYILPEFIKWTNFTYFTIQV